MKFRVYRSLIFLTAASFFAGLSIGYIKFFLLGHLSRIEHSLSDKAWIIQIVGALITLGPCLTFALGGPLSSAFRKCNVMFFAASAVALIMAFGASSIWLGTGWLYVFLAGLGLGLFNAARNSAVPIEAARENISTDFVNACANNLYIVGLLFGVPLGTELYLHYPIWGSWLSCILFSLCAILGLSSRIKTEDSHLKDFGESFRILFSECQLLIRKFKLYLLIAPMLWGIAGAMSLAATAYVEECEFSGPLLASFMSVYAAFGVVSGNFLSVKLQHKRYSSAIVTTMGLGIAIGLIPVLGYFSVELSGIKNLGYILLSTLLIFCGFFFGCATNLIESEYLSKIYEERREGTGAALMSAMTSMWAFILGGIAALGVLSGLLNSSTQFLALAALTCVVWSLIFKLKLLSRML